jgi:hypothetical protein
VYNELNIIGPSRWAFLFYALYDQWDDDLSILHGICEELLKHQTTYVVDYSKPKGDPMGFRNSTMYDLWQGFLMEHYEEVPFDRPTWEYKPKFV